MATSGSTDYALTRNDIITEAYKLLGVGVDGEPISSSMVDEGARSFNLMVKSWQAQGLHLWRQTEGSFTLVAGTPSYLMGGSGSPTVAYRPLRISSARYRNSSGTDLPMFRLTRQEYFDLPLKSSAGIPTQFYYDPSRTQGTFYVWPVLASGSSGTIQFTYERALEDVDAASDEPDFPQEWQECLAYNLAVRLAPKAEAVGYASFAEVKQMAAVLYGQLESWDQEDGSVYLQPDFRGMR